MSDLEKALYFFNLDEDNKNLVYKYYEKLFYELKSNCVVTDDIKEKMTMIYNIIKEYHNLKFDAKVAAQNEIDIIFKMDTLSEKNTDHINMICENYSYIFDIDKSHFTDVVSERIKLWNILERNNYRIEKDLEDKFKKNHENINQIFSKYRSS